jgi:hypothetical protein
MPFVLGACVGSAPESRGADSLRKKTAHPDWPTARCQSHPEPAADAGRSPEFRRQAYSLEKRRPKKSRHRRCCASGYCARLAHNRKQTGGLSSRCLLTRGRVRLNPDLPRRDTKAREDAIPHERGLLPVPPSDFCCIAIADPKARFCCSPPASRHPSTGNPPIPLTLGHLTPRSYPPQRCLAQPGWRTFVPIDSVSRRAVCGFRPNRA